MNATALAEALRGQGLDCVVDARERMAVLVPATGEAAGALAAEARRRAVLELARAHGFTHVAIELIDDVRAPAAVPGD